MSDSGSSASPHAAINADHLLSLSFAIRPDGMNSPSGYNRLPGSGDFDTASNSAATHISEPIEITGEIVGEEAAVDPMADVSLSGSPDGSSSSPWDKRCTRSEQPVQLFAFLSMSYFWFRVEYAIRVAFVAVLPVALLAYLPETTANWNVPGVMLTFAIVVSNASVGTTLMALMEVLRAQVLFLVLIQITLGIDTARHWAGWGVWFFSVCFLVALFTRGLVTKMCLFSFTIHAVTHFKTGKTDAMFSLEFLKGVLVGCAFGALSCFVPFPRFETKKSESIVKEIFGVIAIMFLGLTECVWTPNIHRRVKMVRLRTLRLLLDTKLNELNASLANCEMEVWFAARQRRLAKRRSLALQLLVSIDSMMGVMERVTSDSDALAWDTSKFFGNFMTLMKGPMATSAREAESLFSKVASNEHFVPGQAMKRLAKSRSLVTTAYVKSRPTALFAAFELNDGTPYKHYPYLSSGCFLFAWENFLAIVQTFHDSHDELCQSILWSMLPIHHFRGLWKSVVDLVHMKPCRLLELKEAFKLALAMITAVSFFLGVQLFRLQDPASGTATIAFLMDANPANNVGTGVKFLVGCVVGSVYGLMCNSGSRDLKEAVIWMVVIALVTGFGKIGARWGQTSFFIMFFGLTAMEPGSSAANLVAAVQMNVLAISWLCVVSTFIFPSWSTTALQKEVVAGTRHTRKAIVSILREFSTCATDSCVCTKQEEQLVEAKLEYDIERARLATIMQLELVKSADEEPSLHPQPLPVQAFVQFNTALKLVVSQLASTMIAARISLQYEKRNKTPQAQCVATAIGPFVDEVELFLREMEESCRGLVCVTEDLISRHAKIVRLSAKISKDGEEAFVTQARAIVAGEIKALTPFRVPALHQVLDTVESLPAQLHALMLAAIDLSRIRRDGGY